MNAFREQQTFLRSEVSSLIRSYLQTLWQTLTMRMVRMAVDLKPALLVLHSLFWRWNLCGDAVNCALHTNQIYAEWIVKDQCYHIIIVLSPPSAEKRVQLQTLCMCVCVLNTDAGTGQFKQMIHVYS